MDYKQQASEIVDLVDDRVEREAEERTESEVLDLYADLKVNPNEQDREDIYNELFNQVIVEYISRNKHFVFETMKYKWGG